MEDKRAKGDQMLSVSDLADRLKVSTSWLRRAMKDQGLPHYRLGHSQKLIRFRWAEVDQWMQGREKE